MEIVQSLLGNDGALWRIEAASDTVQALDLLQSRYFDLILCGVNVVGMPGVDFLNEVWQRFPRISRFLIGSLRDQDLLTHCAFGMHQMIIVPCDAAVFNNTLQRGFVVEDLIGDRKFKAFAMRARTFPSIPSLYFRIVKEVQSPTVSAESLAELICKDLAVTTKVLQAANSAFYGLQQQVTQLNDAIVQLGMETLKTLVLSIQLYSQFDKVKPIYFSIDSVWRHCHAVAERARKIALELNGDTHLAEEAFMAGLLHDVGKVVLACNSENVYRTVLDNARRLRVHQVETEHQEFGFTHGEAGGYLASQLGMPPSIIEAITLHHRPSLAPQRLFSPLTAVHIADLLEHHNAANAAENCPPKSDVEYLTSLGLAGRLQKWLSGETVETEAVEVASSSADVYKESGSQQKSPPTIQRWIELRRWLPLAVSGISVMAAAFLWVALHTPNQHPTMAEERSDQTNKQADALFEKSGIDPVTQKSASISSQLSQETSNYPPDLQLNAEGQTNELAASTDTQLTNQALPDFRLQGILYNQRKPTAMINQQWVSVGGNVSKAEVLAIERNQVTLRYAGRDIILNLR
jgi:putative nucleotidyltransferase with HDIG domain